MSTIASEADRLAQQTISENDSTEPLTAIAAAATRQDLGEVAIPDTVDDGVDSEDEFKPRLLSEMLAQAAGNVGMVRLTIKPTLAFVLNMFNDDIQEELLTIGNFEHEGESLNLIQPLGKKNEKSGRVGVLREPMREFVRVLNTMLDYTDTVVTSAEAGTTIIDALVTEFTTLAENTLFANFPMINGRRGIPVINADAGEDDSPGYLLGADNFLRVQSLIEAQQDPSEDGLVTDVTVSVKFVVHLRVPLLLREASDKFEKTLKGHFKYLENAGTKAGIPTTIYAGFNSVDLATPSAVGALNWIRETDPGMEVLSYRNADQGGEFLGVPGFESKDYADTLFNGGDFIVAFNLENEGE